MYMTYICVYMGLKLIHLDSLILTRVEYSSRASNLNSVNKDLVVLVLVHSNTIFSFLINFLILTEKEPGNSVNFHVTDLPSSKGPLVPPFVKYTPSFFGL
jgi:hypothetical protein